MLKSEIHTRSTFTLIFLAHDNLKALRDETRERFLRHTSFYICTGKQVGGSERALRIFILRLCKNDITKFLFHGFIVCGRCLFYCFCLFFSKAYHGRNVANEQRCV